VKGGQGANLVTLTTSDLWVGFLKFRRLDILELAWLHAGGSGLTEKITRNIKNPKPILSSENIMQHLARQQQFMAGNQNVIKKFNEGQNNLIKHLFNGN
jgi:hypothetical protein